MAKNNLRYLQDNAVDKGRLQISVTNQTGFTPIEGARIRISYTGEPGNILEEVQTDTSGQTATLAVNAPPLEYSMEPSENQPYSQYTVQVEAEGYRPIDITGVAVLPEETALQKVALEPLGQGENTVDNIVIPANTLFGNYPAKIAEAEIKPVTESGEIVLSRVVIPEYIIVHDGAPSDNTANNYYVRYRDYIKNVASSEIYATWPDATLRANILAIMSFTLNRVYTEW